MDSSTAIFEFTRAYLAFFYTCVAVFYTVRITVTKRSGVREVVFPGERFSATWFNHMAFRGFRVAIWMVCVVRFFYPGLDGFLGLFHALNVWPVLLVGNVLLTGGFLFTIVTHFSLGSAWRSGIDPDQPRALKTDGLYRFSRNPMFVGVAVAQLGFFLALPSVFSAVCLVVGWYTLHSQARAEEGHLTDLFSSDYRRYRADVRRWL